MEIESDFRKQRVAAIVKRNNLNKARSRSMEQRIAKLLGFRRVPFSGAGGVKGDNIGSTSFGMCILECKMSAGWYKPLECESITLAFAWLKKLDDEVRLMKARFGALVFHYHNVRADYVLMRADWFEKINPDYGIFNAEIWDVKTKTLKLPIKRVNERLNVWPWFFITHDADVYAVMNMTLFAALLKEKDDDDL